MTDLKFRTNTNLIFTASKSHSGMLDIEISFDNSWDYKSFKLDRTQRNLLLNYIINNFDD